MYQQVGVLSNYRHPFLRARYQLLGGLIAAIGLPLALRATFEFGLLFSLSHQVTLIATTCAHLAGYLAYRRLGTFPGVAATGTILPTFALTYGIVFLIIFFFRLDYSRFEAAGSFLVSVMWYFALSQYTSRLEPYRLAIVPGGEVNKIRSIKGVVWNTLTSANPAMIRAQGIVVDLGANLSEEWIRFIADCALSGKPVYHYKQVTESLTGRVAIEHLSENTLGSLNPNQTYIGFKEALDWLLAAIALVALSPLLAAVALAVRLETPGPALFRQQRVGYRGETFSVYKFRTMHVQTAAADTDERERAITRNGDNRVTRLGHFLRRTRIDELPQLVNVLQGEMSLIGPRPEAVALSRWYEAELPFYRYRHIVRPGITGWAQVNQGHVADVKDVLDKLHYDFYYIKNFSPWLDVLITMKTIKTMLTGFGAK